MSIGSVLEDFPKLSYDIRKTLATSDNWERLAEQLVILKATGITMDRIQKIKYQPTKIARCEVFLRETEHLGVDIFFQGLSECLFRPPC